MFQKGKTKKIFTHPKLTRNTVDFTKRKFILDKHRRKKERYKWLSSKLFKGPTSRVASMEYHTTATKKYFNSPRFKKIHYKNVFNRNLKTFRDKGKPKEPTIISLFKTS